MSEKAELAFVENIRSAEIYADEASFFAHKNGNISVTFTSLRWDNSENSSAPQRVAIGRLVMPAGGAAAFSAALFAWMKVNSLLPQPATPAN